jgi:hypothetical protein
MTKELQTNEQKNKYLALKFGKKWHEFEDGKCSCGFVTLSGYAEWSHLQDNPGLGRC